MQSKNATTKARRLEEGRPTGFRRFDSVCVVVSFLASAIAAPLFAQIARLPDGTPDLSGVWQGGGPVGDITDGLAKGSSAAAANFVCR